jgi:Glycosyltransferase
MGRGWERSPYFLQKIFNPQYLIHEIYDKWASCLYTKSDLCVAWSSFGLHTIRKAKHMGARTIIERGSSHMLYQQEILKEEYKSLGLKPQLAHPKIVEKELKEYEEADYISIPSLFVKRTFLEKGFSEKKLIHVPYGVHLDEFKQIPKEDNVFRVIYAGAMSIQKGVHYLLQAFSELKLPHAELLLVGGMNDEIKPFFEKYEGDFKYINHVPQKELNKYYSQGSVFVINSIQEGLAMVQPQAMACGLPVICTTNTGGEDIIRDGIDGFIIPIRNIDALKEKLVYFYEHPDICKSMGQSAKNRVSKGFTWDDYGEKIINAYQNIFKNETE